MKLITEVELPQYPFRLDHHSGILMLGSCFTDNMGKLLDEYLFPITLNPFGTIFNPLSILNGLKALRDKGAYEAGDLEQNGGLYFSFDHYTGFSDADQKACMGKINSVFVPAKKALENAGTIILSWGTSWAYRVKDSGKVVANCHKIPATHFTRDRLSPEEIRGAYADILTQLIRDRPDMRILLTVSPVRHWKDGAHGNQLSKASLLLAADALVEEFPENVSYFPSYEIVMDELRDYRFYASDMLHTNELATSIIWEKLCASLISDESLKIIEELDPLIKFRKHRPRRMVSGEDAGRKKMELKEGEARSKFPFLSWDKMI